MIKEGDQIKLGKVVLKFIQLNPTQKNDKEEHKLNIAKKKFEPQNILTENNDKENFCMICYENEASEENPLMNLCKCKGSVTFYHLNCLKFWLAQKSKESSDESYTLINFDKFKCNVCKKEYPSIDFFLLKYFFRTPEDQWEDC